MDNTCDLKEKADEIVRIEVFYHKETEIRKFLENEVENYNEHLIIDRNMKTLEFVQDIGNGCKSFHKYEMKDHIEKLFNDFDEESIFLSSEGYENVIEKPGIKKTYKITVTFKNKTSKVIEGKFYGNCIPYDYSDFAQLVTDFIDSFKETDILNSLVYDKKGRRFSDYIYCSVMFENSYNIYYYQTEDNSIEEGDYVVVPIGKNNQEAIAQVVDVKYCNQNQVPYPIESTKHIIKKVEVDVLKLRQ